MQEGNSVGPWVRGVSKPYTGEKLPSQYCGWAVSTHMCRNGIQGGNGEPRQHKLNPVSEHNTSIGDNYGDIKAATGITYTQAKANTPTTERPLLDNKTKEDKLKYY